jgi:aminoglycoside 6'-N-acetyltransferase
MRFRFEPVTENDKPMLRNWLSTPDAQAWWGDPDHEIELIYDGEVTGESSGYIVHGEDGPFAYIQSWPSDKQPSEAIKDEPWVAEQPAGTLGVDITIGRPDLLGKGLGSDAGAAFCVMLFARGAAPHHRPDASNLRAVRAYEKAGFARFDQYTNKDGSITLLMEMFPPEP